MNNHIISKLCSLLQRDSVTKMQGNKIKHYTNPNDTPLCYRNLCCPFLNLSMIATQITVQRVQRVHKFCEMDEHVSNTERHAIILFPEYQYRSNY